MTSYTPRTDRDGVTLRCGAPGCNHEIGRWRQNGETGGHDETIFLPVGYTRPRAAEALYALSNGARQRIASGKPIVTRDARRRPEPWVLPTAQAMEPDNSMVHPRDAVTVPCLVECYYRHVNALVAESSNVG